MKTERTATKIEQVRVLESDFDLEASNHLKWTCFDQTVLWSCVLTCGQNVVPICTTVRAVGMAWPVCF